MLRLIAILAILAPAPPPPVIPGQGMPTKSEREGGLLGLGATAEADGSWTYVDPTGDFTARIERDGSVSFADRWRRPDGRDSQNGRCCAAPPPATSIRGGWAMNGPTEWMYKWLGEDVAGRKKAELLRATFDLRVSMAVAHGKQLLTDALVRLVDDLDALRRDPSLSWAERRQRVFELWDDCDERVAIGPQWMGESDLDEARLAAADLARRRVEAWIRKVMPQGSPRGYSAEDIAQLDATRLSREHFDPYQQIPAP